MKTIAKNVIKDKSFVLIAVGYAMVSTALFLYSFTQIDLNITLFNHPSFLSIREPFIQLGYYHRFASTLIYLILVLLLFVLYIATLRNISKTNQAKKILIVLIAVPSVILLLSYPALSHDLFNYMFDARIVTEYGQNPYLHKALDFPGDPWLRFLHWTHRTYPYGPLWLGFTIPFSFLGFGKFLITMVLFNLLTVSAYIGSAYFLFKSLKHYMPKYAVVGTAFFALNPLVIVEVLINAHNDILMIFFAVLSIYYFLQKKRVLSFFAFLFSVGVKFMTVFMLPMFIVGFHPLLLLTLAIGAFVSLIIKIGIQPWYFLWALPFTVFLYHHLFMRIAIIIFSLALLLRYLPFLRDGNWYPSAVPFQHTLTIVTLILIPTVYFVVKKRYR